MPSPTRPARALSIAGLVCAALLAWPAAAPAQDTQIRLGQSLRLADAPIEINADELEVDQATGASVFRGNVRAEQGEMVLTAGSLRLEYSRAEEGGRTRIDRLIATDGVTFVTPAEAVEAAEATYSLADQVLEMRGDVMLVQGQNVLSGQNFRADLAQGTGAMTGGVRTIIQLD
jgi:lipopolysaccharide export system protein LptA